MSWIDSHCHLDFTEFSAPLDLLQQLQNAGCERILVPSISAQYFDRVLAFQQLNPAMVDVAFGLHPYFLDQHRQQDLDVLKTYLSNYPAQAIGEIGLDYMLDPEGHGEQMQYFTQQLNLAGEYHLPMIIHCRKAHDELFKVCRLSRFDCGGIVHGFSGSQVQAKRYLDLGFVIGLGGALTYERAKALHKLVQFLPDDGFVLETDSPDMAPSFARGERNTPLNIPKIALKIAHLRQQSLADIYELSSTTYNRVIKKG